LDDPWEAGHIIDAVLGGGPDVRLEHRSCNRAAGARIKAQIAKQRAKEEAEDRARRQLEATYKILEGAR